MKFLTGLAAALYVAALPLLLVTTSVRFFAGEVRFYERGFRTHDADVATGIALPELDRAAEEIVDYFENDAATLRILVQEDGQEVSLFNTRETEHMKDVKRVMRFVFRVNEVTLAYVIGYVALAVLWSRERSPRGLAKLSLAGVGAGLAAVGVIGALAFTGFDAAWTKFHEIVFQNDLWQLNPDTDHLIQMFPEPFWQEATFIVAGMVLAMAMAVVISSVAYLVLVRPAAPVEPERRGRERREREPRATV